MDTNINPNQFPPSSPLLVEQPKTRKWFIPAIIVILLLVSTFVGVALIQRQTTLSTDAWSYNHTGSAECTTTGIKINISFTNTEANNAQNCMNVTARDLQSNQVFDLGQVRPGETKSGEIIINSSTIAAGQLKFDTTWCDGRDGTNSRIGQYSALTCNNQTISCGQVKIYNSTNNIIGNQDMKVGDTIKLAIKGTTTHPQGITKARFSTNGGATWNETTTKNAADEYTLEYLVPDQTEITIKGQVYNAVLGWN